MNQRTWFVLAALCMLGISTHLLPHPYGFTTVGALGMLAAAYLPKTFMPVPVLVTVLAADVLIGGYAMISMILVYAAHVAATLSVWWLGKSQSVRFVVGASVANAIVFYLISNLAPLSSGFYPATLEGVLLCYTMALPYLAKAIASNLIFGGLAFGTVFGAKMILTNIDSRGHSNG